MARVINVPADSKESHKKILEWLNSLLNNYKPSFYDEAIENILSVSFIKEHNFFINELFQGDGREMSYILTSFPTATENNLLMIHNKGNGVPFLYNKEDSESLFEFNEDGRLIKFFENVTIDLFDANGDKGAECYIVFEDFYGVKCPMIYIKEEGSNALYGKGLIDVPYENRYSGTFMVVNKPIDEYPTYKITNITNSDMGIEVPLLKGLNVKYNIKSKRAVLVPITKHSDYFFRKAKELGGLVVVKN